MPFSQTPLHIACLRGGDQIVKLLLGAGAEFEGRNLDGDCPSHLAAMVQYEYLFLYSNSFLFRLNFVLNLGRIFELRPNDN